MKNLMETLSLAEKILLLHYDDETGARGCAGKDFSAFTRALALAVVFELVLEGRLRVTGSGKKTGVRAAEDGKASGKPILEQVRQKISSAHGRMGKAGAEPINLYDWIAGNEILGGCHEGMGIVYQRLLDEKIIELRDMNRSLTKSSSLARIRGEAIALSKRTQAAWGLRGSALAWAKPGKGILRRTEAAAVWANKALAQRWAGYKLEVSKPQFQGDYYIVQHPFPGERGEIKLSLRRRLNNAVVSFVQLSSVPQDPGIDRGIYKNSGLKIIAEGKSDGGECTDADFLNGILELRGTMVPADIATIAAITQTAKIPDALFPVNRKAGKDVLAAASEDLTAQKEAFGLMGECARSYFGRDARQVLAVTG